MKVGTKAQGQNHRAKLVSVRHGHAPRRSCNAQEKAVETKVRQAGKKECMPGSSPDPEHTGDEGESNVDESGATSTGEAQDPAHQGRCQAARR